MLYFFCIPSAMYSRDKHLPCPFYSSVLPGNDITSFSKPIMNFCKGFQGCTQFMCNLAGLVCYSLLHLMDRFTYLQVILISKLWRSLLLKRTATLILDSAVPYRVYENICPRITLLSNLSFSKTALSMHYP